MSDALSFKKQCQVYDEMVAHGYVRDNSHRDITIPIEIIRLCAKYYHIEPDQFDEENVGICHELDGDILKHTGKHHNSSHG